MRLIDTINIRGQANKRIELLQGDLTLRDIKNPFDLLIVSAFPNDYLPTCSSLIGALEGVGLSVAYLASTKELDLRANFSCWLSRALTSPSVSFKRILCFEPRFRGSPPQVVGDIFQALTPILCQLPEVRSAAMPIVAAGNQGYSVKEMLSPLLDAASNWMEQGLPLDILKIATYSDQQATEAETELGVWVKNYNSKSEPTLQVDADYDVFISYAHENSSDVDKVIGLLNKKQPKIKIFLDRNNIKIGMAWQLEIFESLDRCRKVVAMLSPDYLNSKVCKEEFNIAWVKGRETDKNIIFPAYLYSANLPAYMKYRNYADCREGDFAKIGSMCDLLLLELESDI